MQAAPDARAAKPARRQGKICFNCKEVAAIQPSPLFVFAPTAKPAINISFMLFMKSHRLRTVLHNRGMAKNRASELDVSFPDIAPPQQIRGDSPVGSPLLGKRQNFFFTGMDGRLFTSLMLFIRAMSPVGKQSARCRAIIRKTSTVQSPMPFIFVSSARTCSSGAVASRLKLSFPDRTASAKCRAYMVFCLLK